MADVRRFDIHQKRDPDGEWGDGIPGPGQPGFDLDGFDLISDINGSFGNAVMAVDPGGDVRLGFREGGNNRELDLTGEEVDGCIGPETLGAAAKCDPRTLLNDLAERQAAYYLRWTPIARQPEPSSKV